MEVNNADDSSTDGGEHNSVTEPGDEDQTNKSEKSMEQLLLSPELQTGLSEYTCNACSEKFTSLGQLAKHMQFHDPDRPFPCTICGKRFLSRSHHHEHQRVHTGERPYPCDRCDRTFTTHHNRKRHQMIHKKEEAYRCAVCGVLFCQKHQVGNLSGIICVLKQNHVMEPESLLELEAKMMLEPNFKSKKNKKKKKKRKRKRVCPDKSHSPSVDGQSSRMHSDSRDPQVHEGKVVDVPEILHQTAYRMQMVAYDIEIIL